MVLTPISLEHTAILGATIPEIAREKAGIITPGACVVVAPQRESALDVFREVAAERGASIDRSGGGVPAHAHVGDRPTDRTSS